VHPSVRKGLTGHAALTGTATIVAGFAMRAWRMP